MAYFVACTFDLKNASYADYQNAYSDLAAIGLHKTVVSSQGGKIVAPTTMTMGEFTGQSTTAVRDYVRDAVRARFSSRGLSSEVFVVAADDTQFGLLIGLQDFKIDFVAIAALLTLVGYSVNEIIVNFARIREVRRPLKFLAIGPRMSAQSAEALQTGLSQKKPTM